MERELLEECLAEGMSLEAIGKRMGRHESTVSYWLKKHGLEAARVEKHAAKGAPSKAEMEALLAAGLSLREIAREMDRSLATIRHWDGQVRTQARAAPQAGSERRRIIKRKLVEEAGGKCLICGYDRCQQALEFHHLDPSTKEFHLALKGVTRSLAKSRAVARKCVLLCSNCHSEVEAGIVAVPLNSVPDATLK